MTTKAIKAAYDVIFDNCVTSTSTSRLDSNCALEVRTKSFSCVFDMIIVKVAVGNGLFDHDWYVLGLFAMCRPV